MVLAPLSVVAVIVQRDSAVQQAHAVAKQNERLQTEVRACVPKVVICQGSCITACCQPLCVCVCVCVHAKRSERLPAPRCDRVKLLCRR